jgi:hypothetical protein
MRAAPTVQKDGRGPTAGLDTVLKITILYPSRESNPGRPIRILVSALGLINFRITVQEQSTESEL